MSFLQHLFLLGKGGEGGMMPLLLFSFPLSLTDKVHERKSRAREKEGGGGERAKAVCSSSARERETDMMDVERGGGRQTQGVSKRFRTRSANFLGLLCFVSLVLLGRRTGELIRGDFWKKLSCLHGCKSQAGFRLFFPTLNSPKCYLSSSPFGPFKSEATFRISPFIQWNHNSIQSLSVSLSNALTN